jgi:hypothetical protein
MFSVNFGVRMKVWVRIRVTRGRRIEGRVESE